MRMKLAYTKERRNVYEILIEKLHGRAPNDTARRVISKYIFKKHRAKVNSG